MKSLPLGQIEHGDALGLLRGWPDGSVQCVVADPFAGSGTVGVVAYKLGREFAGIDLMGGGKDFGGHTAHDRLEAARRGKPLGETVGEWEGRRVKQEILI